jgi:hypothetical protein
MTNTTRKQGWGTTDTVDLTAMVQSTIIQSTVVNIAATNTRKHDDRQIQINVEILEHA